MIFLKNDTCPSSNLVLGFFLFVFFRVLVLCVKVPFVLLVGSFV